MHLRASIRWGPSNAWVGQASRQRVQLPQWSGAGASGSSSRLVRMTPRNSQLPCSRRDEVGVLALPADPGGGGQRLFHHRRGVDEHLELAPGLLDQPAGERFERLLDRLVIVAALRIDRDPPGRAVAGKRHRVVVGRVAHAQRDRRLRLRPQRVRRNPLVSAPLDPFHRPVAAVGDPLHQMGPGVRRGIGAREAAGDEAKSRCLRLIASFSVEPLSIALHYTVRPEFVEGPS